MKFRFHGLAALLAAACLTSCFGIDNQLGEDYIATNQKYNLYTAEFNLDDIEMACPDSLDGYDTIFVGYPNWWASIPMPIATFLESYDFSGKTIIPFCSHGGGRFGQSLTAIAKLAPDSVIGEGLSVHYSGGSTLDDDISEWLDKNGISTK